VSLARAEGRADRSGGGAAQRVKPFKAEFDGRGRPQL
jgi:hypothetical protein